MTGLQIFFIIIGSLIFIGICIFVYFQFFISPPLPEQPSNGGGFDDPIKGPVPLPRPIFQG